MELVITAQQDEEMGPETLEADLPAGLLDELAAHHGTEIRDNLRSQLNNIGDALGRPHVTLVFGGHFSSGKSTMLNTLTGRTLLPASDFPETGVACVIQHGETERIVADTSDGLIELPFTPDALAGRVSLVGQDGDYRQEVGQVKRILITLVRSAVPAGDTWIDSPGINDTALMTARALEVARGADALIWVVNSRQPLSTTEEELLRSYTAEHGTEAVAFLVNVFLRADTPEEWNQYLATRSTYHQDRIAAVLDADVPPAIALISARAAGADPASYGGPQARELLNALSNSGSAQVRAVRQRKAARELHRLADQFEERVRILQSRLAEGKVRFEQWQAKTSERRRGFETELAQTVGNCFADFVPAVETVGTTLAAEMSGGTLHRDGSYTTRLTAEIESLTRNLALELFEAIGPCAAKYDRRDLPSQATTDLRSLLQPGSVEVVVPDHATQPGALVPRLEAMLPQGAVPQAERTVGWMKKVAERGRRTIDGAREAGKDGSNLAERVRNAAQGANAALQEDRTQAQANAISEAKAAAERLAAKQSQVLDLALAHCGPAGSPPPVPDEAPVRVLVTLIDHLHQQAHQWDHGG
jgi:hypothetical protein